MKAVLNLIIPLIFIISCEPATLGPCVHIYDEPILTIISITGEDEGNDISTVNIYNIKIDNEERYPLWLTGEASFNVSVKDSVITCTTPCGFGTEGGNYQFSVSADGFEITTITTDAKYGKSKGGCPSSSSEGTRISLVLRLE